MAVDNVVDAVGEQFERVGFVDVLVEDVLVDTLADRAAGDRLIALAGDQNKRHVGLVDDGVIQLQAGKIRHLVVTHETVDCSISSERHRLPRVGDGGRCHPVFLAERLGDQVGKELTIVNDENRK